MWKRQFWIWSPDCSLRCSRSLTSTPFAAQGFTDDTIARFDREVQFYIACIEFVEPLKRAGLSFCFPTVSDESKQINAAETFDLALAASLVHGKVPVDNERFLLDRS